MITAIQIQGIGAICDEMKNLIPRWLHFVPRFPQSRRNLGDVLFPQRRNRRLHLQSVRLPILVGSLVRCSVATGQSVGLG